MATTNATETEKAIRENFPGRNNAGLRAKLRTAAQGGSRHAVLAIERQVALTASGKAGLRAVADTLPRETPGVDAAREETASRL
jgi:hypothetical protein